jgi:hypothetical protein
MFNTAQHIANSRLILSCLLTPVPEGSALSGAVEGDTSLPGPPATGYVVCCCYLREVSIEGKPIVSGFIV